MKIAIITGSCGFIGFHISKKLLSNSWQIIGVDSFTDYYDVLLKRNREGILKRYKKYISINSKIEKKNLMDTIIKKYKPNLVIHLAAQAGVRYSIESPNKYITSNIIGTFKLLEALKKFPPEHTIIASTSSVYGTNKNYPFNENHKCDNQVSIYAATKKSCENLAHTYSHLYNLPITVLRFFTVYGPWGRPDMALFKFTRSIINGTPIDIYNNGNLFRDFTYIDDLVKSIFNLIKVKPNKLSKSKFDSISNVAPFRILNIGNQKPIKLKKFISTLENIIGKKAKKNYVEMQKGDVYYTHSDTKLLKELIGFVPSTRLEDGIKKFYKWYKKYYYK